ncbi:hypothetical protein KAR34_11170 [bacterium]|nr:hypothetical protein [bacterium]
MNVKAGAKIMRREVARIYQLEPARIELETVWRASAKRRRNISVKCG